MGCSRTRRCELGFFLYDDVKQARAAAKIMQQLYAAFMKSGALARRDQSARHDAGGRGRRARREDGRSTTTSSTGSPTIAALRDESAEAPSEVEARNANLTFIKLDGNVGCVVNGAGLAMATMDLVKYYGGEPANFLDIGGSSNPEKVVNALRIITADPNVKAILFNIFGGITRTDDVANGIVTATKQNPLKVPIVIRLTGTNEEIAMKILKENGFSAMTDMDEAVQKAVAARDGRKGRVSIFIDKNTTADRPGHHGPRRIVPHAADDRVRHAGRRRRHAREGRPEVRRQGADLQHGRRGGEGDRREHVGHLRAADVRRRRDDGSGRCRHPVHRRITEGVPVLDMTSVYPFVKEKGARLLGPNCPGLISPGKSKVGIIPGRICTPGPVGVVSRSGTLTYEVVYQLTRAGIGPDDVRRHRRRPDQRHELHRLPRGVRGGSGHEGGRA